MATQLTIKNPKNKANWKRMLEAANKLDFSDGRLVAAKGWKIDDMDVNTISAKLTSLGVEHEVKDLYTIIIN